MEQQEGYRIHAWGGDLRWEAFARPTPTPGEVLVQVEACGIGLTVLNAVNGDLSDDPRQLPRVPGHELVGRVAEVGDDADADLLGRRVVAYFYLACGRCRSCVAGDDARCLELAGWVGVHRDGGYAPWCVLPTRNAVPVPDHLDPVAASVVPDAVATPLHVCERRADVRSGDRVVVIGAGGGVGLHTVQVARLLGARVAGIDLGDRKLAAIEEHGADPVRGDDLDAAASQLWGGQRPTVVVDLVGSERTLRWSADTLATGGRLVVLTTFRDRVWPLDPRELVFRELTVLGSRYASRDEVSRAADLVADGRVRPVVGETVGPADVPAVHAALRDGDLVGRGALTWGA